MDTEHGRHIELPSGISIREAQSASYKFLKAALRANGLYFLLTIFAMSADKRFLRYQATSNKLLQDAVISKARGSGNAAVGTHDAAYVILSYYESMSMLVLYRQLADICIGEEFLQFPWKKDEIGIIKNANNIVTFKKSRMVKRILEELRCVDGAAEFCRYIAMVHSPECFAIRNAIAHGTYSQPTETDPYWEFGILKLKDGKMGAVHIRVAPDEMGEFVRSIVSFRIGFLRMIERYRDVLNKRTIRLAGNTLTRNPEKYEIEFSNGRVKFLRDCTPVERDSRFEKNEE